MKGRIFFAITLIVFLSLSLNAVIAFNETCIAFPEQLDTGMSPFFFTQTSHQ
jgi:hypothetical protein